MKRRLAKKILKRNSPYRVDSLEVIAKALRVMRKWCIRRGFESHTTYLRKHFGNYTNCG